MDVEHLARGEFRFVLARMNTVNRTHVDAGSVLGFNARVCDDERHARESPSGITGPGSCLRPLQREPLRRELGVELLEEEHRGEPGVAARIAAHVLVEVELDGQIVGVGAADPPLRARASARPRSL